MNRSKKKSPVSKGNHSLPKRYIFALLAFVGLANAHSMRNNLNVVLLAMVNNTNERSINGTEKIMECPNLLDITPKLLKVVHADQYNWTEEIANKILGSFFYGYVFTQIPGGYLAEQISGKWLFGGGIFITALFTVATPLAVRLGVYALMITRIMEGLAEGVIHSSINSMISRWSPKCERSRVSSFIFTGAVIGNVFTFSVSGFLSSSRIFGGWPSVFYFFGALSITWFIFWYYLAYNSPMEHPYITENELLYFEKNQETIHKNPKVPWKDIFISVPMWAVIFSHFGTHFGIMTLFSALPTYFDKVLHFDIEMDGNLTALPILCEAIGAWTAACLADVLREADKLSITYIRKIFNTIGTLGPAVVLLFVTVSGCRPLRIVTLICLAMTFHGFSFSGYQVTHIDMSPDFAGVLFGISSSLADLNGIIGPALVTYFTYNETKTGVWNKVFYAVCSGYTFAAIVYLLFASAELQPWGLDKKAISIKESLSQEESIPIKERKNSSEKTHLEETHSEDTD